VFQQNVDQNVESAVRRANMKLAENVNPPPAPPPLGSAPTGSVKARTFADTNFRITPLLRPDPIPDTDRGLYVARMLDLIKSAKTSLDIQLQYVEVSKNDVDNDLKELLLAVKALVDNGVQVRVLQSLQFGKKWAEQMRSMPDIDFTAAMRLQPQRPQQGLHYRLADRGDQ
jgi:hypothetical protein